MIVSIFSIYDNKAAVFSMPFTHVNADVAKRAFKAAALQEGNQIHDFPSDFSLIEIGHFDDANGDILSCQRVDHGPASLYIQGE